jgi:hypothetical protein
VLITGEKLPRNENDGTSRVRRRLEVLADANARVVHGKRLLKKRSQRFEKQLLLHHAFSLSVCLSTCSNLAFMARKFAILYIGYSAKICQEYSIFFKIYKTSNHFYGNIIYSSSSYSKTYSSTMRIKVALLVN